LPAAASDNYGFPEFIPFILTFSASGAPFTFSRLFNRVRTISSPSPARVLR